LQNSPKQQYPTCQPKNRKTTIGPDQPIHIEIQASLFGLHFSGKNPMKRLQDQNVKINLKSAMI